MRRGFTLVEGLVVIGMIGILVGLGMPLYSTFRQRSLVTAASDIVSQSLRQAMLNAQAGRFDSPWGVDVNSTEVMIYAGTTYTTRVVGSEVRTEFPSALTIGGTTTFNFMKQSGKPLAPGSVTIANTATTATVNVLSLGTVTN